MVLGRIQHYSTHFIKKLGKSLELFFHQVQKSAKKGKKGQKIMILAFFLPFFHLWSIFVDFEQKKKKI